MMKKFAVGIISVAMFAGMASAQIAVLWESEAFFASPGNVGATDIADYIQPGALHVLLWSATAAPTEDWAAPGGNGAGAGEFVVFSGTASSAGGAFDYTSSPIIIDPADIGGADPTTGYVYSRIFQGPGTNPNDWYFQSLPAVNLGPGIPEYDFTAPGTIQDHFTTTGTPFPGPALGDTSDPTYGAGMYQVIPEPSVFAMLGLGGLFLALRRRYVA